MNNDRHHTQEWVKEILADIPPQNFILFLQGDFRTNKSYDIVSLVEVNFNAVFSRKVVRRLLFLVVEAVQNIERYSFHSDKLFDFVLINNNGNHFKIITQNSILNKDIEPLKKRLDALKNKHAKELSATYMDILSSGEGTSKGAGLGLVDMTRKSKNALGYQFNKIDDQISTFQMQLTYTIPKSEEEGSDDSVALLEKMTNYFHKKNSGVFYSGDFSNSFLTVLLDIIQNFDSVNNLVHHAVIEAIQNIKKHGRIHEKIKGLVAIKTDVNKTNLSTCNPCKPETIPLVSKAIDELNAYDEDGLNKKCLEVLSDQSKKGSLGLVNIAQYSRPNMIYCSSIKMKEQDFIFINSQYSVDGN